MVESIDVLLIEYREILRRGVSVILREQADIAVIAETDSGAAGLALYTTAASNVGASARIDVVLTALELPDRSGIDVTRRLKEIDASTPVILLALWADTAIVREAIAAGVDGFLLYGQATPDELVMAVRAVAHGGGALSPALARLLLRQTGSRPEHERPHAALTRRELEVLRFLAEGETSKGIGAKLNLSPRTIDNHRIRILDKLGADSTAEALVRAVRQGLLGPRAEDR